MPVYKKSGDLTESSIHKAVIQYVKIHPILKKYQHLIMHFANERKCSLAYGKHLKMMGVRKGVYDLFIATSRHCYHGAWIELKSSGGALSKEQKQFCEDMRQENYFTAECWSIEEAIKVISWYFGA